MTQYWCSLCEVTHISVVVEGFLLSFWTIVQTFTFELKNVGELPSVIGRVQDKQRGLDVRKGVLEGEMDTNNDFLNMKCIQIQIHVVYVCMCVCACVRACVCV